MLKLTQGVLASQIRVSSHRQGACACPCGLSCARHTAEVWRPGPPLILKLASCCNSGRAVLEMSVWFSLLFSAIITVVATPAAAVRAAGVVILFRISINSASSWTIMYALIQHDFSHGGSRAVNFFCGSSFKFLREKLIRPVYPGSRCFISAPLCLPRLVTGIVKLPPAWAWFLLYVQLAEAWRCKLFDTEGHVGGHSLEIAPEVFAK